jgi:hypothetical protein
MCRLTVLDDRGGEATFPCLPLPSSTPAACTHRKFQLEPVVTVGTVGSCRNPWCMQPQWVPTGNRGVFWHRGFQMEPVVLAGAVGSSRNMWCQHARKFHGLCVECSVPNSHIVHDGSSIMSDASTIEKNFDTSAIMLDGSSIVLDGSTIKDP